MLTADNKVIGVPHNVDFSFRLCRAPLVHKHIDDMMQEDVCEKRGNNSPLRGSLLSSDTASIFLYNSNLFFTFAGFSTTMGESDSHQPLTSEYYGLPSYSHARCDHIAVADGSLLFRESP